MLCSILFFIEEVLGQLGLLEGPLGSIIDDIVEDLIFGVVGCND
jgi:hypothetical protein